jgi:hypothetical protein
MQDGKFELKNRMRQPLPLEYAGKSISLAAGGILECTETEFSCAEIQRNIKGRRLKLIAVPVKVQPEGNLEAAIHAEEEVQEVTIEDPIVYEMAPETAGPVQEAELEEEKDGDSLTSKSGEPDNGTVEVAVGHVETINACGGSQDPMRQEDDISLCQEPAKKRRKRSRSGKRDDKDQE